MVGKRKANSMMEQIAKMAKKNNEEKEEHDKEAEPTIDDGWRTETKEEYFDRVLKSSSSLDRVLEFLRFRKQADELLPSVGNDLVALVRRELEIDTAISTMKLETRIASGEGTPILDALGAKRGTSFANIVAPPTKRCLLCTKDLKKRNEPSTVALFTVNGPVVGAKYMWRCRSCTGAPALWKQTLSTDPSGVAVACDIHYGPDSFGNSQVVILQHNLHGTTNIYGNYLWTEVDCFL